MCPSDVQVVKIVDRETALLYTFDGKWKRPFVVKGLDTSTWGHTFEVHVTLWVTGTTSLVNEVNGETETYSLVEPFDWAKYKKQNAELPKR